MAYIDHRKNYRGRKARLGSLIMTDDYRVAFFVTYCDCGCQAKIGLGPDEARLFAKRFHRESETALHKLVASPGRAMRHTRAVLREANKLAQASRQEGQL